MILVDTSVLIGYFKGSKGAPYDKMNHIIDNEIPYGICYYVYQELLQGAANEKEYGLLKDYLSTLPFYTTRYGKESFENAARMYMNCRKKGITVRSTIDLIIAEIAIENNLYLFHNDNDFTNISKIFKTLKVY
ncbi:MAG: PIN domain nuclease [Treponema sp.]|nr:PIN domain nuclease [Treponema sp.]